MLTKASPLLYHRLQNALLILVSLFFLPLSTSLLTTSYCLQVLIPQHGGPSKRRRIRRSSYFTPKTILVTGMGMAKGLSIARSFYEAGHDVIGADFEADGIPVNGRFSKALKRFYRLSRPDGKAGAVRYIQDLLQIVEKEKIDLWIPCSDIAFALDDGQAKEVLERKTSCTCIQFDVQTTKLLQEKNSFIRCVADIGLPVPETHDVTSRTEVHNVLQGAHPRKKYVMKNASADDFSSGGITLLPRRTMSETYQHVCDLQISKENPWVLQQFVRGEKYCTHALIVRGEVKVFVACPSSDLQMHYQALSPDSGLSKAMLNFTQEFAEKQGGDFTGHGSFDFMVEETATETGVELKILPIKCDPGAHTAVVLFEGQSQEMAKAYLEALAPEHAIINEHDLTNGYFQSGIVVPTPSTPPYYWIGQDLVSLVLRPFTRLLRQRLTILAFLTGCMAFIQHVLFWKDGTYELWDPLPGPWLYHLYWPGTFLICLLRGRRWSTVSVTTGQVFGY